MGAWFARSNRGFVIGLWSSCANVGNIIGTEITVVVLPLGYEVHYSQ
jgi:sugar phosphate permease